MQIFAFKCPICHSQWCPIKVAKTGKSLYFHCVDCGLQAFIRFNLGKERLMKQAMPLQVDDESLNTQSQGVVNYAEVFEGS